MSAEPPGQPQVLIIGAGPVGLTLACDLARRGVAIRIVDKRDEPTDESRAIVVHARSLELVERLGVVDELIAAGVRTTGLELHAGGRSVARVPLDTVDSPFPFSVTVAQTETERILAERLAALGVTVERGRELVGLEQDAGGVRSTLRDDRGGEAVLESAWVAGTDGSRSSVRGLVGTKLEGSFKGERFLLGDVEAEHDLDQSSMHTFFPSADGPLLVFPMAGRRMRVMAQLTDGADGDGAPAAPTLEQLQVVADERAGGIRLLSAHWLTTFEIHHAQVPRYRHGRAFLAGDAAHVHSPAGGQGMNTGMQDAFNLGWKLALAADGRGGEALLDSYDAERHPVAARVIELTTRLTDAATLKGELARWLRNHVAQVAAGLAPVQHAIADMTEETDVAYRDSPIVAGGRHRRRHGGPRPGDAAPDVPGTALREALLGGAPDVAHTVVTVAGRGSGAAPAPPAHDAGVRQVLVAEDPPEERGFDSAVRDPERRVADRYGLGGGGGIVVVRPDGYIGLLAELDDHAAVTAYLDALHG